MKSETALPAVTPKLTVVPIDNRDYLLVTPTGRTVARVPNFHDAQRIRKLWNEWRKA